MLGVGGIREEVRWRVRVDGFDAAFEVCIVLGFEVKIDGSLEWRGRMRMQGEGGWSTA